MAVLSPGTVMKSNGDPPPPPRGPQNYGPELAVKGAGPWGRAHWPTKVTPWVAGLQLKWGSTLPGALKARPTVCNRLMSPTCYPVHGNCTALGLVP